MGGVVMPKKIPQKREGFNPFGDLLGITFTQAENGYSQCALEVNDKLMSPQKALHGGVAYSMADTGMGGALYSIMESDELCASVEISIVYFRVVTSGTLICDTKVINRGKRIAILESEVQNDGCLIAKALGTFSIFKETRS
jgi:acyl-CoA thioesterase